LVRIIPLDKKTKIQTQFYLVFINYWETTSYRFDCKLQTIINSNYRVLLFYLGQRMLTEREKLCIPSSVLFPKCCFQQELKSIFILQGIVCLFTIWYFKRWFNGPHNYYYYYYYYYYLSFCFFNFEFFETVMVCLHQFWCLS